VSCDARRWKVCSCARSRRGDQPHESVDGRTVDPAAPELGDELAEQQRRPVVLERLLGQPPCKRLELRPATGTEPGVLANQRPMLAAGLRPHRVVKDRPWRRVEHRAKQAIASAGAAVRSSGTNPSHRSEQSCSAIPSCPAGLCCRRTNLGVEREVPGEAPLLDRLREPLEPLDLGVGEKPGRHEL
jgi:hypothetical protein